MVQLICDAFCLQFSQMEFTRTMPSFPSSIIQYNYFSVPSFTFSGNFSISSKLKTFWLNLNSQLNFQWEMILFFQEAYDGENIWLREIPKILLK